MHGTMAGKEGAAHVRRLRSLCTRTGFDGPKQQEGVRPVLRRGEWGGFDRAEFTGGGALAGFAD